MPIIAIDSGFEDGGTYAQQMLAERLLHSAIIDPDRKETTLLRLCSMTVTELDQLVSELQQNQLNPVTEVGRYGQKELNNHIKTISGL